MSPFDPFVNTTIYIATSVASYF